MNIPKLKQLESVKKYHDIELKDEYSWVDQPNILEVLKDPKKLLPDVKKYIEENNNITENYFADVKNLQKKLFNEIKSKIKLDDTSLKFKDKKLKNFTPHTSRKKKIWFRIFWYWKYKCISL